jgi:hypothetical protein
LILKIEAKCSSESRLTFSGLHGVISQNIELFNTSVSPQWLPFESFPIHHPTIRRSIICDTLSVVTYAAPINRS